MNKSLTLLSLMLVLVLANAGIAQAVAMNVYTIEGDDYSTDYSLDVSASSSVPGAVDFTFATIPGASGVITQIYFYVNPTTPVTYSSDSITAFTGWVSYNLGSATPPNLPGIKGVDPYNTYDRLYAANPISPSPTWGVNAAESVTFTLLFDDMGFDNIWSLLSDGDMAIGFHAQSQGPGKKGTSSSYLTTATPIPGSILLLGSGLFGLGFFRRKKAN